MDSHAHHKAHMMPSKVESGAAMSAHGQHHLSPTSGQSAHMDHGMKMYFNTDAPFYLLFQPWHIDTSGKLIGAFIGVFLVSMLYEGCMALREKLLLKAACRERCPPVNEDNTTPLAGPSCPSCPISSTDTTKGLVDANHTGQAANLRLPPTLRLRHFDRFFDGLHLLQTLLHLIQMFIGYMLMLIVMTYNLYMLIAVMAGFTLGHLVFARQRPLLLRSPTCCH